MWNPIWKREEKSCLFGYGRCAEYDYHCITLHINSYKIHRHETCLLEQHTGNSTLLLLLLLLLQPKYPT